MKSTDSHDGRATDDHGRAIDEGEAETRAGEPPREIPTELRETARGFVAYFDIPGATRESLRVHLVRGALEVEGRRAERAREGRVHVNNRPDGAFRCVLPLPPDAVPHRVSASYSDGVLTVHITRAGTN